MTRVILIGMISRSWSNESNVQSTVPEFPIENDIICLTANEAPVKPVCGGRRTEWILRVSICFRHSVVGASEKSSSPTSPGTFEIEKGADDLRHGVLSKNAGSI
jgi:hypothetical protein